MKIDSIIFGFITVAIFFLMIKAEDWTENFFEWALGNAPWLVIVVLALIGVFIALVTIINLKESYKKDPVATKKYIIQNLKVLGISVVIALLVVGFIIYSVKSQY